MSLRTKMLLVFVALGLAPAVAVVAAVYLAGARTAERLLRADAERDASRTARAVESTLSAHEAGLVEFALSRSLRDYVRVAGRGAAGTGAAARGARPAPPDEVRERLSAFFNKHREHFDDITCLDAAGRPLFRVEDGGNGQVRFRTEDFVTSSVHFDGRVWDAAPAAVLRPALAQGPYGASLASTVPVFTGDAGAKAGGALVGEIKLSSVIESAAGGKDAAVEGERPSAAGAGAARRVVVALDNATGRVVYHTNDALKHQSVIAAMPFFGEVAGRMRAGEEGADSYEAPDGRRWVAALRQVRGLGASVAVAGDYTASSSGVRRAATFGGAAALVAGLSAVLLLSLVARRATGRIERVTAGAAAIAGGDLEQRIDVRTSDETSLLAASFNRMSDRLRELIEREAETKQFESFMRLSAMLTHDLKNAITGLSMLVSNMEKQFHREEFRADAISSLKEAAEKLRRIVARLNEPVKSLSGEYRREARETDLVPVIRRVLATTAEPSVPLYEIETRLPESLRATVEPQRIENVIENLVINALESMGAGGGRLTVEAGREGDGLIFLSVADTGAGMSESFIRTRLFRPFATTKNKGIGLGLFTVREVVEAHGGRLEVESELGTGTRFRVVLPSGLFTSSRERRGRPPKGADAAQGGGPGA